MGRVNPQYVVVSATTVRGFYLSNPFELKDVNASLPTLPARFVGRFSTGPDVSVEHMLNFDFEPTLSTKGQNLLHLCQDYQMEDNCRYVCGNNALETMPLAGIKILAIFFSATHHLIFFHHFFQGRDLLLSATVNDTNTAEYVDITD